MYNIDSTFFTGIIAIPNTNEIGGNALVEPYIEQGCYLFLYNLLGAKLYNELKNNLDSELDLKDTADQKWKDLFFGKEYNGKFYNGLIQKGLTISTSVLAEYTFIHWLNENLSQRTGVGNVVIQGKGAINVNYSEVNKTVWNSIVEKVGVNKRQHRDKTVSCIRGTRFVDYYGEYNNDFVSIKQFLLDNSKDFPSPALRTPKGEQWEIKNFLGL